MNCTKRAFYGVTMSNEIMQYMKHHAETTRNKFNCSRLWRANVSCVFFLFSDASATYVLELHLGI